MEFLSVKKWNEKYVREKVESKIVFIAEKGSVDTGAYF